MDDDYESKDAEVRAEDIFIKRIYVIYVYKSH